MNSFEYWLMNNPLRAFVQRRVEAPRLFGLLECGPDSVLEIGCGQGVGAKIIHDTLRPQSYVGIDLDARMIHRARSKAGQLPNSRFIEGDASKLAFEDATFDLAVDFGIIHHIPNWRDALAEIHRTLKPGGEFLFEDLSTETWETGTGRLFKRYLEHPYDQMFSQPEFEGELTRLGFAVETYRQSRLGFLHFWGRAAKPS